MLQAENLMIINTETGEQEEILGKYMYYSFPKMIVKAEKMNEICTQIGFPVAACEVPSVTDAFRSATGGIYDRIEETAGDETKICKIYCRDNKRVDADLLSRELVEETLYQSTNTYRKLANISLDKQNGELVLSDVDDFSDRDIRGYFERAETLFRMYRDCVGNRSIETMAAKYVDGMHAIGISARGHHFFIPKAYMHKISLLEVFMELVAQVNLFSSADGRDAKDISINSMYVADDAKQRGKMARDFYQDMGREIEEYQRRITKLIQNGNSSQRILDRWELKFQRLESKKREYEQILKQDLSGVDEEFTMLRDMCDQYKLQVRSSQIFGVMAA